MPKYKIIVQDDSGQIVSQSEADKFIIASSKIDAEGKVSSFCDATGDLDRLARLYLLLGRHLHSQLFPDVVGRPNPEPKNKVKVGD